MCACVYLHVKFKPRLLDKGKGKRFLLVCDFRGLRRLIKEKNNRFVCMFWVKYFSFAEKEGVKNTHCERGDEATARELLSVLPTLQNWGTTLPVFECAFYGTFSITFTCTYIVTSCLAHPLNKVTKNITFLETNYPAV